jgi:hypothetical protein
MTRYVQGTLVAAKPESVGVITDFVNPALTEFIKEVATKVCYSFSFPPFSSNPIFPSFHLPSIFIPLTKTPVLRNHLRRNQMRLRMLQLRLRL